MSRPYKIERHHRSEIEVQAWLAILAMSVHHGQDARATSPAEVSDRR